MFLRIFVKMFISQFWRRLNWRPLSQTRNFHTAKSHHIVTHSPPFLGFPLPNVWHENSSEHLICFPAIFCLQQWQAKGSLFIAQCVDAFPEWSPRQGVWKHTCCSLHHQSSVSRCNRGARGSYPRKVSLYPLDRMQWCFGRRCWRRGDKMIEDIWWFIVWIKSFTSAKKHFTVNASGNVR